MPRRSGSKAATIRLKGGEVRRQRVALDFSQDDLARRASLSKGYISLIENERAGYVSSAAAKQLAGALAVPLDRIAGVADGALEIGINANGIVANREHRSSLSGAGANSEDLLSALYHQVETILRQIDRARGFPERRFIEVEEEDLLGVTIITRDPNQVGLLHDITRIIAAEEISIKTLSTSKDRKKGVISITMDHPGPDRLLTLQHRLSAEVETVENVSPGATIHQFRRLESATTRATGSVGTAQAQSERAFMASRGPTFPKVVEIGLPRPREVTVNVEAEDRTGLIRDITEIIAAEKLNITALATSTCSQDGRETATVWFTLNHPGDGLWTDVEERLRQVRDVLDVTPLERMASMSSKPAQGRRCGSKVSPTRT